MIVEIAREVWGRSDAPRAHPHRAVRKQRSSLNPIERGQVWNPQTRKIATRRGGVAFRYQAQDFIDAYRLGAGHDAAPRAAWLALGMAALAAFLFWSEPDWIVFASSPSLRPSPGGGAAGLCYRFLYLPWLACTSLTTRWLVLRRHSLSRMTR